MNSAISSADVRANTTAINYNKERKLPVWILEVGDLKNLFLYHYTLKYSQLEIKIFTVRNNTSQSLEPHHVKFNMCKERNCRQTISFLSRN